MQQGGALVAGMMAVLASPALALDLPDGTDPVFAEAYTSCIAAIEGGGFLDESQGWIVEVSGDVDAVAWESWSHGFATKDVPGVGGLNLSATVETYASTEIGTCSVTITEPQREIAAPALRAAGFLDRLEGDGADWSGLWQNPEGTLFLRGLMSSNGQRFSLIVTTLRTNS